MRLKTMLAGTLVACSPSTYANDLHVPTDYATIQDAVDAAVSGDTIHIAPGVYTEQAVIYKNLTLLGQPGTILRAFPNMDQTEGAWAAVVVVRHHLLSVTLRDLTFEGDQLADQQTNNMIGVLYLDSGGEVANCHFTGFRRPASLSGEVTDNPLALAVWNDLPGAPLYDFRIAGNTFVDSIEAVDIHGTPDTNQVSLDVTIENNVVRGIGPTDVSETSNSALTGIDIGRGVTGTILGNTISGLSYNGTNANFPFGIGIILSSSTFPEFLPLPPFRFENNIFRDNDVHLSVIKSDQSEIVNNRFEGAGETTFAFKGGVYFSGEDVVLQGNKFFDTPQGIIAWGDDPIFGLIPGIATNAVIADNRFCNVGTNIVVQTLATATVTGTLECPIPPPDLDIANSVLLSWPEIEEDYVVECAPTPEGPWTNVAATHFLQDGNNAVSVPVDSEQKYFRLVNRSE